MIHLIQYYNYNNNYGNSVDPDKKNSARIAHGSYALSYKSLLRHHVWADFKGFRARKKVLHSVAY